MPDRGAIDKPAKGSSGKKEKKGAATGRDGKAEPHAYLLKLTEHRGITLRQLKDLENDIKACADKNGRLSGWVDKDGKTCTVDTVNLYDVVKYLVNPKTGTKKCSYVELVAPEGARAQTPKWFVSHWWGEPVKDFIACLVEHARVRRLSDEEAVYWVCCLVAEYA